MNLELTTLEWVYWISLGVGLILLALTLVLGDIFDSFDVDIGDTGLPILPVFLAAVSAFGAGGLLGTQAFGFGEGGSIITGIGVGVVAGGLTAGLFVVLRHQESPGGFETTSLVGERGRVIVAVGPNRRGRVSVLHEGMTRSFTATSTEEIPAGEEIVVRDVLGGTISVGRPDRSSAEAAE